ncbi:MAG: TIGR04086 family membrane protein [Oscillospiraceae bacterium]|nr:TIGR04086 family membrane protein [Oscillospiraceae bacterium]
MAARKSRPPSGRRLRVYIASVAAGIIAAGLALVLSSLLVFVLKLPVSYSGFFALISFGLGCLVAGFTAGAMKRQGGMSAGVKAALLFMTPVVLVGFVLQGFVESAPTDEFMILNRVIVAVMCGAIGGVLGVNRNNGF